MGIAKVLKGALKVIGELTGFLSAAQAKIEGLLDSFRGSAEDALTPIFRKIDAAQAAVDKARPIVLALPSEQRTVIMAALDALGEDGAVDQLQDYVLDVFPGESSWVDSTPETPGYFTHTD